MPNVNALSLARDVMIRDLIVVGPDTSLLDIHRLFVEEEIHGAPVIDEQDQVLGVVSTMDLLRATQDVAAEDDTRSTFYNDTPARGGWTDLPEESLDRVRTLTAADIMTKELVRVSAEATLRDVAREMLKQRVHRVLVTAQGNLVGVISTFDLVRVLAGEPLERKKNERAGFVRA